MAIFKFISFFMLLISLMACDAPRKRRTTFTNDNLNAYSYDGSYSNASSRDIVTPLDTSYSNNSTTTDSSTTNTEELPADASHCTFADDNNSQYYRYSHEHVGSYNICKSSNSDKVYLQFKEPNTTTSLCLIPTVSSGSKSTYIGEAQCYIPIPGKVVAIPLIKNRNRFQNAAMSGVMIMRDEVHHYDNPFGTPTKTTGLDMQSPDAYFACANALDIHADPRYCQAFDNVKAYVYTPLSF